MRAEDGGSSGTPKLDPLAVPEGVVTYRRRRDKAKNESASQQVNGKTACKKSICNGIIPANRQARVFNHWKSVLDGIVHSTDFDQDHQVHSCIQMALSRGPLGLSAAVDINDVETKGMHKDHPNVHSDGKIQKPSPNNYLTSTLDNKDMKLNGFHNSCKDQADVDAISKKCENVLFDVLISQKFAFLCDLLCEGFQGSKSVIGVDLSLIIGKMKDGIYSDSMERFDQDLKLVWEKFRKIGQEMSLLACSLSSISRSSYMKQMRCSSEVPGLEQPKDDALQDVDKEKETMDLCISPFVHNNIESSTEPNKVTDASHLSNLSTCKNCGTEANIGRSLICDGCEAVFHITCIRPAINRIPKNSWYCLSCSSERGSVEPNSSASHDDCQHQNCMVCDRLEASGYQRLNVENPNAVCANTNPRECSGSSIKRDELSLPEPSRTAELHLCKKCGTCEDDHTRFLICSNNQCYYKFYHIRCLKASQHEKRCGRWYCPSCLCQACLTDRDDEWICMCDGCDEAYHTYCMKPPQVTVPTGTWYCVKCNMEKAKKAMQNYEKLVLRKHGQSDVKISKKRTRAMDILASAAKKLKCEDDSCQASRIADKLTIS